MSTIAGNGTSGSIDGVGAATFYYPKGLDIQPKTGDLYIADYANFRIRKISTGTTGLGHCFLNCFF